MKEFELDIAGKLFDDPVITAEFIDISLPDGKTFNHLKHVPDDESRLLDLKSSPTVNGLFSNGFSSCVAVIMKSQNKQRFSLAHLTNILTPEEVKKEQALDPLYFDHPFAREAKFVSYNFTKPYDIEIGISFTGYLNEYLEQIKDTPKKKPPFQYFLKQIPLYEKAVWDFLGKKINLVHLLEKSTIFVDRAGEVHTFSQYDEDKIIITVSALSKANKLKTAPAMLSPASSSTLLGQKRKRTEIETSTQFSPS